MFGFASKCSGNLVCCVAPVVCTWLRAGQLTVNIDKIQSFVVDTLKVLPLQAIGLRNNKLAIDLPSIKHVKKAQCISALLSASDRTGMHGA